MRQQIAAHLDHPLHRCTKLTFYFYYELEFLLRIKYCNIDMSHCMGLRQYGWLQPAKCLPRTKFAKAGVLNKLMHVLQRENFPAR